VLVVGDERVQSVSRFEPGRSDLRDVQFHGGGGTDFTPLLEEDLFLVERQAKATRTTPKAVALKDIAALPLVIPSRPNAIRMLVESGLANLGLRPHIALEIDGVAAILELVADGAGSAVLSRNAVATSGRPQAFALRPITPRLRIKLSIAVSSQRPATLTQKAMLELIQHTARELLA